MTVEEALVVDIATGSSFTDGAGLDESATDGADSDLDDNDGLYTTNNNVAFATNDTPKSSGRSFIGVQMLYAPRLPLSIPEEPKHKKSSPSSAVRSDECEPAYRVRTVAGECWRRRARLKERADETGIGRALHRAVW